MDEMDAAAAIDLHDVAKTYRRRVYALRGVTMRVRRGEIFGLLGPNGAGKSTLVKIMMTVIRPTRAGGAILGQPLAHKPTLARIGYLPEDHPFPPYLNGQQVVEYYAALCGVDRPTRKRRAQELLRSVGLEKWARMRVSRYSKGMRQRVGVAQALGADPELVMLDEPTDGLDPAGRRQIRDVLLRLREQGKSVFVNSHLLSELEMICDRVAILVGGRVVRQGTIEELTVGSQRYEIELDSPEQAVSEVDDTDASQPWTSASERAVAQALDRLDPPSGITAYPGGDWYALHEGTIRIPTADPRVVQPVIDALRRADITIRGVRHVRQSLEDLYMEATREPAADNPPHPPTRAAP